MNKSIKQIVLEAAAQNATDIHIVANQFLHYRIQGTLIPIGSEPLTSEETESYAEVIAGSDFSNVQHIGELDLAKSFDDIRTRINVFHQRGTFSIALRILRNTIPRIKDIHVPESVITFTTMQRGIILVTGETGSGKSTTLAAIINEINHTRNDHIITLEDPIEYVYTADKCVINQREVGTDVKNFADGLRASLREDPDIIMVGEMRDAETMEVALNAAETGHLVLSTLHTKGAADSVDRIIETFPGEKQHQIRIQLASCLNAVLSQQLLPNKSGGRSLACELMISTVAIRNMIREGQTHQINNAIATTSDIGNISMDTALINLYRNGEIAKYQCIEAAHDVDDVRQKILRDK